MRILVVEDDPGTRILIQRVLRDQLDANVRTVPRGDQAIAAAEDTRFDVVLLDHQLPDTTGLEVLDAIRARNVQPAVVFLTGAGSEEIAYRALSRGAVDYQVKGIDTYQRLGEIVQRAVDRWSGLDELVRRPSREVPQSREGAPLPEALARFMAASPIQDVVLHDRVGRVLASTIGDREPAKAVAARAASLDHQAGSLGELLDAPVQGRILLTRGPGHVLASASAPGRACLVCVLDPGTPPEEAMDLVRRVNRLLRDAFPDGLP